MIAPNMQTQAMKYLSKKDPVLGKVIKKVGVIEWIQDESYFYSLVSSIVSQQLSMKAADTIWKRFEMLLPGGKTSPESVIALEDQAIRDAGISWSKIKYIKDLAKKTLESGILFEQFEVMKEEEIIEEPIKVKGIGRWTAEMFLMFNMQRPDVFSYGDLGLRRAVQKLYKLRKEPSEKKAAMIANKWKPYRTIACRYLWKSLEL